MDLSNKKSIESSDILNVDSIDGLFVSSLHEKTDIFIEPAIAITFSSSPNSNPNLFARTGLIFSINLWIDNPAVAVDHSVIIFSFGTLRPNNDSTN